MTDRMPELANAACRDPQAAPLFNTRTGVKPDAAAEICNRCFDRPECLAWGLEHERNGIWGGHGISDLNRLRKQFGISLYEITGSHLNARGRTP